MGKVRKYGYQREKDDQMWCVDFASNLSGRRIDVVTSFLLGVFGSPDS